MGCLQSRRDISDLHPNVFRVINLDENGMELCSGQIEVTESDLILYREGRDTTVWPLHSLRRYGFEGVMFSFESGRRCETGEGIYAFRCHRAALLFRTLQQQIQLRNIVHEAVPYPASRLSPSQTRQTLQASVVHRSSIDNGLPEPPAVLNNSMDTSHSIIGNMTQSPRSPSSADILEVMPLYPRSQNNKHVTNVYQLRDFKKEHNNNQTETSTEVRHDYSNDINRDLAILRNTLHQETVLYTMSDNEYATRFLKNRYMNNKSNNVNTLSPTLSNSSERYAQLSLEQPDTARLYMNIIPDPNAPDANKSESPATPLTPKQIEYCNLNVGAKELNTYANLSLGELADTVKNAKFMFNLNPSELQVISETEIASPKSPIEESEVNYAILDIDSNKEARPFRDILSPETQSNSSKTDSISQSVAQSRSRLISQTSLDKSLSNPLAVAPSTIIGYTTIDFDKTVALTSVATGNDIDPDCQRKTRHNSNSIICSSPNNNDKSKSIN